MSKLSKVLIKEPRGRKPEEGAETPYHLARQYSDDRLGNRVVQTANWRRAFWASTFTTFISMGALVATITKPPLPPLVVEVNHTTGVANVVGRLGAVKYEPQLAEMQYFIGKFLGLVRNISTDPVVVKKNWLEAYKFTRQSAANLLNQWAQQPESQLSKIGRESVSIEVISVNKVTDSKSLQARWRETVFTDSGAVKESYIMTGIFTIEVEPPKDERTALTNPLGVYIKNFQWNKEVKDSEEQHPNNNPTVNQQS